MSDEKKVIKDRFCDTAKLIFDENDFSDVENAIAQLNLDQYGFNKKTGVWKPTRTTAAHHGADIDKCDHVEDKPLSRPGAGGKVQSSSTRDHLRGATKTSQTIKVNF